MSKQIGNFAESYLAAIERLTGRSENGNAIIESSRPGLPPVTVLFFNDWPVAGVLSAFTLGVSLGSHVEEIGGHPELVVSLETTDRRWALALGVLAEQARDQAMLSIGSTLDMPAPITDGSPMTGFMLTRPHHLDGADICFRVDDRDVVILEAHPVLPSELVLARQSRAELSKRLFGARYDVNRAPITGTMSMDPGVESGLAPRPVERPGKQRTFRCRICSFESEDSSYCPECLADTMIPG